MKKNLASLFLFVSISCNKKIHPSEVSISVPIADLKDTSTWTTNQPLFYKSSLSKGVNLSNWFNSYSDKAQYATRFNSTNFKQIRDFGFTHVRIPIAWEILFLENNPSTLNPNNIHFVDNALKSATDAGLVVILDALHGGDERVENRMATDENYVNKISIYWKAVIKRYRFLYHPDQLFFEVMNEPHVNPNNVSSILWWPKVQKTLIDSMRAVDQHHYIIVGGGLWNSIYGLKKITPYPNIHLIYNFHFYDAMEFTHQGATWAGDLLSKISGVPYPSSPPALDSLVKSYSDPSIKNALTSYGNQYWNRQKMDSIMKDISGWAASNNIDYLTCNEFGSYKPNAPRQGRLNWVDDVRQSLEKYKIGWTMWEYDEGFGLIEYLNGNRNISIADSGLIKSLGL
ncbi:MAG: glycoside hydrolase family 5 protein [Flavisolibacter sp.]